MDEQDAEQYQDEFGAQGDYGDEIDPNMQYYTEEELAQIQAYQQQQQEAYEQQQMMAMEEYDQEVMHDAG